MKAQRYAELGVPHYWVVDPEARRLVCHPLAEGAFRQVAGGVGDAVGGHPDSEGFAVDLAELWPRPTAATNGF